MRNRWVQRTNWSALDSSGADHAERPSAGSRDTWTDRQVALGGLVLMLLSSRARVRVDRLARATHPSRGCAWM